MKKKSPNVAYSPLVAAATSTAIEQKIALMESC
jgi:hypothetical protein